MRDAWIVLQKELLELAGERHSRRGGLVQAVIMIVLLGIVFPLNAARLWLAASPLAIIYFAMLPAVAAATVAADAFAGERERRTLETLLATPLSERSILVGKGGAAIAFALGVTALAFVCAVVTVNVTAHPVTLFLPSGKLALGAMLGSFASASLSTGLAVVLSLNVPVARSVQQMTSLSSMALFAAIAFVWSQLGLAVTWANVFVALGAVLLVAAVVFELARATFRRDRVFERR
jgi:ABC-2 type transport system permease protein